MVVESVSQDVARLELEKIPQHVAIIMDGNGRWAQERGLSRQAGHRAGTENIRRVIETFARYEVPVLTLFAFSTENWSRPRGEVNHLIRLIGRYIDRELKALHENGVRFRHLGRLDPLSPALRRRVEDAVELTKNNDRITVNVAFNYGGRQEILDAVRRIVEDGVPPERIDEELFSSYLYTAGLPDGDLVIRTAGEMRLSNFLLWQCYYAEYYVTPVYWPDFGTEEIEQALLAYSQRQRRFGGVVDEEGTRRNHRRGRGPTP
ncbi:MAG: di-trans,poly-cis-decaprenylcistransferase [Chloroflexi bacterium RBG_16_68_14]|nr:MAG: di-trans,poly-cis-decaprenylcistransferase [Chloroflexi bacterium RBG_16_68_14]